MVDGCTGGEDNGRKIGYVDLLLAKFLGRKALNLDEWTEHQLHAVFLCEIEIRRLVGRRPGLRYEDLFDIHYQSNMWVLLSAGTVKLPRAKSLTNGRL